MNRKTFAKRTAAALLAALTAACIPAMSVSAERTAEKAPVEAAEKAAIIAMTSGLSCTAAQTASVQTFYIVPEGLGTLGEYHPEGGIVLDSDQTYNC